MKRAANLTFLFTDLVGSTGLLDRLGDEAGERLMRGHFATLRAAISQHDGHVVKCLGDGIMAIFRRPADGIACAAAMQHGVARHNVANPDLELAMRVGVHCGPAIRMAGDYYGIPVVIAKRLCDHCVGGQVLVSEVVRAAGASLDALGDRAAFEEIGSLMFKGLSEAVSAVELRWENRSPMKFSLTTPAPSVYHRAAAGLLTNNTVCQRAARPFREDSS